MNVGNRLPLSNLFNGMDDARHVTLSYSMISRMLADCWWVKQEHLVTWALACFRGLNCGWLARRVFRHLVLPTDHQIDRHDSVELGKYGSYDIVTQVCQWL